ncbi:TrkA-C domain protein [Ectocarpus siliculosus]|uniref:TrkA-C domain protein n=1 Tax=Ectocarpus siliculosus TaxID=2880 RepID=D8LFQ0_ECTSI|nr:TrkA-C domain protein [Ectocarpus siliculosus]|eukprot:CBN75624.1 TrkA-C domain protein [Ectocarpus siliculosus]
MADSSDSSGSPAEAAFMGVVLTVMFISLFVGLKTPETVVFFCLVLVWNVGLVNTTEALSGFSNAGMLAVGALFVVIKGVEKSQLADKAARRVFGLRTSLEAGLGRMMSLCFVLSAFLNNTPVVALLIPITRDWARARGFSPSIFLIPLSYSCIMGGLLTVIGTSTNLVVQGLVLDEKLSDPSIEAIGFFEPGYIGVPLGVVGMLYLVLFAPRVLPSRGGLFRYVRDRAKELLTEVQVMDDFPYKGEPAGLVLARLGLPQDTLIKIRRKISSGILRQMSQSLGENASLGFSTSALYSSSVKEGATHDEQDVNAIMEVNQKTFRAESMYSYRMRAECLWGTKDDLAQEEKCISPLAGTAVEDVSGSEARKPGRFSRKRWVSDADAQRSSNAIAAVNGNNATPNGNASATAAGNVAAGQGQPNGGSLNAAGETYTDIFPVSPAEPVQAGDVLFLSCAQAREEATMIDFQAVTVSQGLKGLKFLDVSALDLPGHGTEFFEIVLSGHNHFVGRSASRDNAEFAAYYNVSVVAVRRRGQAEASNPGSSVAAAPPSDSTRPTGSSFKSSRAAAAAAMDAPEVFLEEGVEPALNPDSREVSPTGSISTSAGPKTRSLVSAMSGRAAAAASRGTPRSPMMRRSRKNTLIHEDEKDVTETSFKAGDVVLVLAKEEFMEKYGSSRDFFLLTKVGSVPKPVRYYDYLPLLAFVGMLVWVLLDAEMVQAAFTAGAILIFGGWVDAKKTVGFVDWSLLLLIGSALGLSKGIVNSGLADYVGGAIRSSGISADASLFVLYGFTMIFTELITNNAAAALATPIAFSISRELEVSYKPFILTVMLAASSSFITPIGYQTNTLVWGPGGYKFTDFMKIGTPLSLIYLVLGSLLVPQIFPF